MPHLSSGSFAVSAAKDMSQGPSPFIVSITARIRLDLSDISSAMLIPV